MADYAFTTIWRLDAPIERVHALIEDVDRWPEWWPSVVEARDLTPGTRDVGSTYALTFRGRLPYLVRVEMRVTRHEPPTALEGVATGELDGVGRWALRAEGDGTVARYDWQIRTSRWWMNLLAPLPFVRRIFELNHHAVMRDGLAGARRELGVDGSYERLA